MKVLTLKLEGSTLEVHMLNPGQHFEGFGGSSRGLTVGKTASIVTRLHDVSGVTDTERNLDDGFLWGFIAKCISGEIKAEVQQ